MLYSAARASSLLGFMLSPLRNRRSASVVSPFANASSPCSTATLAEAGACCAVEALGWLAARLQRLRDWLPKAFGHLFSCLRSNKELTGGFGVTEACVARCMHVTNGTEPMTCWVLQIDLTNLLGLYGSDTNILH